MVLGSFIDPTGHWDQVSKPDQNRLLKRHIWHTCGIDRSFSTFKERFIAERKNAERSSQKDFSIN